MSYEALSCQNFDIHLRFATVYVPGRYPSLPDLADGCTLTGFLFLIAVIWFPWAK